MNEEIPESIKEFSKHLTLRRQGREWVGKSPFREEITPSFCVNPKTGTFHCFASGYSGTYEDFLKMLNK